MEKVCNEGTERIDNLTEENHILMQQYADLQKKCKKMEDKNLEYQHRLVEQSNIMKTLNVRKILFRILLECIHKSLL